MLKESDFTDLTQDQLTIWEEFCHHLPLPTALDSDRNDELGQTTLIFYVPGVGRVVTAKDDYKGFSDPQIVGPLVTARQVSDYDVRMS